jgi:predicted NACHT family NTPase
MITSRDDSTPSVPANHVASFLRIEGDYYEAPDGLLEHSPVCLVGPPGAGKTTTLALLAKRLRDSPEDKFPVFVACRNVRGPIAPKLGDFISQFIDLKGVDDAQLSDLVLIFDGIDEVATNLRAEFTNHLQAWIEAYRSTGFVISTRPATYEPLKLVTLAEIDSGSDAYIKAFVEKAIADPSRSHQLLSLIQTNDGLRSLAASPLLLNLLVSLFVETGAIPDKMADLYSAWTDTVLRKWDKSRGIGRSIQILTLSETRGALSAIALGALKSSQVFFTYSDWLAAVLSVTERGEDVARNTLHESALGTGIIVERGVDVFSFVHLTIQEYFAALALLDEGVDEAFAYLRDTAFIGVERFYAEMTPHAGELAAFLLDCGDLEAARRVISENDKVGVADKRRLIELAARKLGVGTVSFDIAEERSTSLGDKKATLRAQWRKCEAATASKDKGDTLEIFAKSLFGEVFDVVSVNRQTSFGEIDLICEVKQAAFWQRWPGDCFVECKNQKTSTGVDIANEFAGKCSTIRLGLAFLVSVQPLTKPSKDRLARSWGEVGTPDMAWLDGGDIAKWLGDETDAESLLKRAVRRAGYGITL